VCIYSVGPAMIRSSSKNHAYVSVLTSPSQYTTFVAELNEKKGNISYNTRRKLAAAAFALTNTYDGEIAAYFKSVVEKQ
jgi:phosphoribosylaminoimidazolecarboxamide formyltransferase/IMP cyclohydrolase